MWISLKDRRSIVLSYTRKRTYIWMSHIFVKTPKNFIFGLFRSSWPVRVYFKHQTTSLFLFYNTSWKKLAKIGEPFPKTWQKVKWSQIHWTLLPSLNAPLNAPGLVIMSKMYCLILRFDFLQTLNSQKNKTTKTEKEIRQTLYMTFGLLQS